ncbi:ABC transporter permease [Luteipulveratus mongoliensis]|uniref:ABC transporter permease n=1 Tax=Luteipulveratus mongoliensis TaxID=571913 RepID=A0A0K1JNN8_9MICO|nr:ABC transporter permease [Luteipulveratus mongoliensis]AKU18334.1 ABC transporter permease [Luteipulveratus mongoliensis]
MILRLLTRLGILMASLAISTVVVFAFMVVLPGNPARVALGVNASDDAVAQLERDYGLDRPKVTQYFDWVGGLLHFDLGTSYISRAAIGPQVADRLQVTLWLVATSMIVAVLIAVPLGILMAVRHRKLSGLVLSALSQLGVAIPAFLAGLLLVALFAVRLGWLPANGWTAPADDPVMFLKQLVLPVVSLGIVQGALLARYVRSAVLDVMREDYIRTARAKGLRPMPALVRHGLRNAAIPVVTVLGLQLSTLLVGAVVIERVFVIPGLGSGLLDAVANRDLLMVQDIVVLLVAAVLIVNFVVDVLYLVIDPRLRSSR